MKGFQIYVTLQCVRDYGVMRPAAHEELKGPYIALRLALIAVERL